MCRIQEHRGNSGKGKTATFLQRKAMKKHAETEIKVHNLLDLFAKRSIIFRAPPLVPSGKQFSTEKKGGLEALPLPCIEIRSSVYSQGCPVCSV
jgi:hypothetical protein